MDHKKAFKIIVDEMSELYKLDRKKARIFWNSIPISKEAVLINKDPLKIPFKKKNK